MCFCVRHLSHFWSAYLTVTLEWFVIWMFGINKWSSSRLIDLNIKSLIWGVVHCLTFWTDISVIVCWTLNKHFFSFSGMFVLHCEQSLFFQSYVFIFTNDWLYLVSTSPIFCEILCSKLHNHYGFQTVGCQTCAYSKKALRLVLDWLRTCYLLHLHLETSAFVIVIFPNTLFSSSSRDMSFPDLSCFPLPGVPLHHGWLL